MQLISRTSYCLRKKLLQTLTKFLPLSACLIVLNLPFLQAREISLTNRKQDNHPIKVVKKVNHTLKLTVNAGRIGIADNLAKADVLGMELQYNSFEIKGFELLPAIGFYETQGGAQYSYLSFQHDFWLGNQFVLTPSLGLGYFRDSHDIQLGNKLEFISSLQIAYELPHKFRIGLKLSHISNGGISNINPGTESLTLAFTIPILD
ncbi:acyloxyacyl hydrolase [Aliikangiella marina]|uniref:Acyloxyacyl hydrolase n=1 Tax=Aliikangiella marina TaxID=1712262 RepID=A0A545TJT6_9GAMM|nr:acyloxyacyl hydrolase [Aliikangiella marina]TQV77482.1 acyloxyacyl hydrolase [Aliikangiella marina]